MTLRMTVGSLAVLLALFVFLPDSGDTTGLPPGVASEDCNRHTPESSEWISVFTCIRHEPFRLAMVWDGHLGAETYQVSGDINYLGRRRCGDEMAPSPGFRDEFTSLLDASQTWYQLPAPDDWESYFLKSFDLRMEALDSDGKKVAQGGFGGINEEALCPEDLAG